ncbi:ferrous iron transport protein A [bacterium]|nr:ferrous iron transport protein A [bacterium]
MNHTNELARIHSGQSVRVTGIQGGWHMRQRLNQMGIHIGDTLRVRQTGAFHGPMLIEIHGSQVALGCGMARKIMVEIVDGKNASDK